MGGKGSKSESTSHVQVDSAVDTNKTQNEKYRKFRDQLLSFSMGESAYDYAERLFEKEPDEPEVMALLAETCVEYDKTKNKVARDHWIDRLDLLQRGVDVSRKCFNENPEYGPCYRSYVLCATRESEALYYWKSMQGLGLLENYKAIMRRGHQSMNLMADDAEVPNMLGALNARCALRWYDPTRFYGWLYGVPSRKEVLRRSIELHKIAVHNDPSNLEYACRLAQAYYQIGDRPNARRWYVKVRDEMPPQQISDERWQGIAHTQLTTALQKVTWNVPFA